ncbi:hypothetical protein TNCV_2311921 [Trichonephila clavipes]|nr:hypothetical protein TNCV_2311921 [Trichonephila clavipes]
MSNCMEREGDEIAQMTSSSLDRGSKLRGPSPIALVQPGTSSDSLRSLAQINFQICQGSEPLCKMRKGNEEIYRSMSAGASTSSPTTEDAVVANNTTPSSGTPG